MAGLFIAAVPYTTTDDFQLDGWLVVSVVVAAVAAALALALARGRARLEPLVAIGVLAVAGLMVLWDTGTDTSQVDLADWAHAAAGVVAFVVLAVALVAMGTLRDNPVLTVIAMVGLVVFTTFQSFAVFAAIVQGAWLFLVLGLVLLATGLLFDRARREIAASLRTRHRPGRSRTMNKLATLATVVVVQAALVGVGRRAAAVRAAHRRHLLLPRRAARPDRPVPRCVRHARLSRPPAGGPAGTTAPLYIVLADEGGVMVADEFLVSVPRTTSPTWRATTTAGRSTAGSRACSCRRTRQPRWRSCSPTARSPRCGSTAGATPRSSTYALRDAPRDRQGRTTLTV